MASVDFLNGKTGGTYINAIGPAFTTRANVSIEYIFNPMTTLFEPTEVNGWKACLTEVMDGRFSVDAAGVSFGSVYWVRTRTWRQRMADGGGDVANTWVAVPKTLSAAYTPAGRMGVQSGHTADYIGGSPKAGFEWNRRGPRGDLIDTAAGIDQYQRTRWSPMNYNQEVWGGGGAWYTVGFAPFGPTDFLYESALESDVVGFRGGVLTITSTNALATGGTVKVFGYSVLAAYPGVQVASFSVSIGAHAPGPAVVVTVSLPEVKPTTDGIRWNFYMQIDYSPSAPVQPGINWAFQWSSRVDIPLFYDASMGNRVAPGGYIA